MGLLDDARNESGRTAHNTCDVDRCRVTHPDQFDDIVAVIRDPAVSTAGATRAFAKHGIPIRRHTIERHRKGECRTCADAGRTFGVGE